MEQDVPGPVQQSQENNQATHLHKVFMTCQVPYTWKLIHVVLALELVREGMNCDHDEVPCTQLHFPSKAC